MLKIYSKRCEYVMRALADLSYDEPGESFTATDLCERAGVPEASTRKGFQQLVCSGLLQAVTGPGGGYQLLSRAEDISLYELVAAIDGEQVFEHCIMSLPQCGDEHPCPIHHSWKKIRNSIVAELKSKRLKDLMQASKKLRDVIQ